jgi:hypothetical protein
MVQNFIKLICFKKNVLMIFCIKMQEKLYLGNKFYDPRISRINKIMYKICPKFLDLYTSIYGTFPQMHVSITCRSKFSFMSIWKLLIPCPEFNTFVLLYNTFVLYNFCIKVHHSKLSWKYEFNGLKICLKIAITTVPFLQCL